MEDITTTERPEFTLDDARPSSKAFPTDATTKSPPPYTPSDDEEQSPPQRTMEARDGVYGDERMAKLLLEMHPRSLSDDDYMNLIMQHAMMAVADALPPPEGHREGTINRMHDVRYNNEHYTREQDDDYTFLPRAPEKKVCCRGTIVCVFTYLTCVHPVCPHPGHPEIVLEVRDTGRFPCSDLHIDESLGDKAMVTLRIPDLPVDQHQAELERYHAFWAVMCMVASNRGSLGTLLVGTARTLVSHQQRQGLDDPMNQHPQVVLMQPVREDPQTTTDAAGLQSVITMLHEKVAQQMPRSVRNHTYYTTLNCLRLPRHNMYVYLSIRPNPQNQMASVRVLYAWEEASNADMQQCNASRYQWQ